jgi:tripartite-type tricarboxylate transporter receptor subunit TctC
LFKQQFGLQTVEVKYKESQAGMQEMIGTDNLSFIYVDPAGSAAHIAAGRLRPLCVTTKGRVDSLKDIPGSAEVGIMNSDVFSWWSVHTPKGVPQPILDKLEKVFNDIVPQPDVREFLSRTGSDPFPGNHKLAHDLLEQGLKDWAGYVKLAKIEKLS